MPKILCYRCGGEENDHYYKNRQCEAHGDGKRVYVDKCKQSEIDAEAPIPDLETAKEERDQAIIRIRRLEHDRDLLEKSYADLKEIYRREVEANKTGEWAMKLATMKAECDRWEREFHAETLARSKDIAEVSELRGVLEYIRSSYCDNLETAKECSDKALSAEKGDGK